MGLHINEEAPNFSADTTQGLADAEADGAAGSAAASSCAGTPDCAAVAASAGGATCGEVSLPANSARLMRPWASRDTPAACSTPSNFQYHKHLSSWGVPGSPRHATCHGTARVRR